MTTDYMISEDTARFVDFVERFDSLLAEVKASDIELGTDLYSEIEWNGLAVRDKLLDLVKMSVGKNITNKDKMI